MSSGCRRRKKGAKRDIFRVAFEKCTSWLVGLVDNVVEIEIEHCRRHQQQQQQQQQRQQQQQQQFAHTTPTTTNALLAHNICRRGWIVGDKNHTGRGKIFLWTTENISRRQVSLFASIRHSNFKLRRVHLKMLIKVGSVIHRCRFLSTLARFSSPP
ncbi:hypothetical protein T02_12192 [Trichinella nativa]|uniref:Uncharacterized protein n=1 Tax=Trichinella nativa TaxID=6335 RepID=A0A0V1L3T5_9BILA|nr:hypothetical protein T02_12192 [Trichinella nativa]